MKRITLTLKRTNPWSGMYHNKTVGTGNIYVLRSLFRGRKPPRTITILADNVRDIK